MKRILLSCALLGTLACQHRVENVVEGTRLRVRSALLPSGEETAIDLWDARLKTPCRFVNDRCVPVGAVIAYRDGNCTQPLAVKTADVRCNEALGAQSFAVETVRVACEQQSRVFRVGPGTSAPAVLYAKTESGCTAHGALAVGDSAYELGQAIGDDALIHAERKPHSALNRIGFAEIWVSNDGARVEGGSVHGDLFDRELGSACTPRLAEDNTTRCLPASAPLPSSNEFADAACTQAVLRHGETCDAPPAYASEPLRDFACSQRERVWSVTQELSDVFRASGEACLVAAKETISRAYSLSLTEPSRFARLEAAAALPAERLSVRAWAGDDGKRLRVDAIIDSELQIACHPVALSESEARCLPLENAQLGYTDASCRQAIIVQGGCTAARYATRVDSSIAATCATPSIYRMGAEVPAPAHLYVSELGTCIEAPLAAGATYARAELVPIESFAPLTLRQP